MHHISGVFQLYLYQTSNDNACGHSAKDKKGKKTYFFYIQYDYYKNNNSNYYFLLIDKLNNIINNS